MLDLDTRSTPYVPFPPAIVREVATGAGPIGLDALVLIPENFNAAVVTQLKVPPQTQGTGQSASLKELILRLPNATRIAALKGLDQYLVEGWDGEGAAPISADAVGVAGWVLGLLPAHAPNPDVGVGADGSLCLEWLASDITGDRKLFVDLGPTTKTLIYMRKGSAPPYEAHPLWNSAEFLRSLVVVLTSFFDDTQSPAL